MLHGGWALQNGALARELDSAPGAGTGRLARQSSSPGKMILRGSGTWHLCLLPAVAHPGMWDARTWQGQPYSPTESFHGAEWLSPPQPIFTCFPGEVPGLRRDITCEGHTAGFEPGVQLQGPHPVLKHP